MRTPIDDDVLFVSTNYHDKLIMNANRPVYSKKVILYIKSKGLTPDEVKIKLTSVQLRAIGNIDGNSKICARFTPRSDT